MDIHQRGIARVVRSLDREVASRRLVTMAMAKGGLGNTFFTLLLHDWLADRGVSFAMVDADGLSGTLTRFVPSSRFLFDDEKSVIAGELNDNRVVVVDGLGRVPSGLPVWLDAEGFSADASVRVTAVVMIEEDKDAVFQAGELVKALGDRVDWLVVKTAKTCATFEIYDTSHARREFERVGAIEVHVPRMPWSLVSAFQRTSRTVGALAADDSLPLMLRQRFRSYQRRTFDELDRAASLLLPRLPARVGRADFEAAPRRPRIASEVV